MTDKQLELYQSDFAAFVSSEGFRALHREIATAGLTRPEYNFTLEELARQRIAQSGAMSVLATIESYATAHQTVFDPFNEALLEDDEKSDDALSLLDSEPEQL